MGIIYSRIGTLGLFALLAQTQRGRSGFVKEQNQTQLTPADPERTIDPLIAAQVHNDKNAPLSRLPEEILLEIVNFLSVDDIVSLYCLRRVSRTFRRVIYEPDIWEHVGLPMPRGDEFITEQHVKLSLKERTQLKQLLRRDGMCSRCKSWSGAPVEDYTAAFPQRYVRQAIHRETFPIHCRFRSEAGHRLHCGQCGSPHDTQGFSPASWGRTGARRCLGRQGGVQLCEHVHIYWADIEDHISYWREKNPDNYWRHCFDSFVVECNNPSHDTRCSRGCARTWPRATLTMRSKTDTRVFLRLEWRPHSGLRPLVFTPGGRGQIPAPELRAIFQGYRQGAGGILLPSRSSSDYLPEMTCFSISRCQCVYYDDKRAPSPRYDRSWTASFRPFGKRDDWWTSCDNRHWNLFHGKGDGSTVDIRKHVQEGASVCFVTTYRCDIRICREKDGKINVPSHDWLHAMDPDTYDTPHASQLPPMCRNGGCMNFYRRPRGYYCFRSDLSFEP